LRQEVEQLVGEVEALHWVVEEGLQEQCSIRGGTDEPSGVQSSPDVGMSVDRDDNDEDGEQEEEELCLHLLDRLCPRVLLLF
jgi:hypothetical protein